MAKRIIVFLVLITFFCSCGRKYEKPRTIRSSDVKDRKNLFKKLDSDNIKIKPACNNDYLSVLYKLIKEAERSVDVLQFELNRDDEVSNIFNELIKAVERGVEVRILAEDSIEFNKEQISFLLSNGIKAKLDKPYKKIHSKLIIIDDNKAIIGSTNWSYMSLKYNNETNVFIEGKIVKTYKEYYERLWNRQMSDDIIKFYTDRVKPLIEKDYYHHLIEQFKNATREIDVCMYGIKYYEGNTDVYSPDNLLIGLIAAKQRGVKVRMILEQSDFNDVTNENNREAEEYLENNGIKVKWETLDTITHAKLVIIDNEVIVGSTNWGFDALRNRAETNISVKDEEILRYFKDYYNKIYQDSVDNILIE
ncbi:MAG: phospholipase D-like domain-containing protein [Candidatus Hydrogenedentota bacterium]